MKSKMFPNKIYPKQFTWWKKEVYGSLFVLIVCALTLISGMIFGMWLYAGLR